MKCFRLFLPFLLLYSCGSAQKLDKTQVVSADFMTETQYFQFYNNFWINLHHFLYESASGRQKAKLAEDSATFRKIGDEEALLGLSLAERESLESAIDYYSRKQIDQPLLFSGERLKWLQSLPLEGKIPDGPFDEEFSSVIQEVAPIYRAHFWERHRLENERLLGKYIVLIQGSETEVIRKLEQFSGESWEGKVRVDLSVYGNWASAYSPADDIIVVSSIDPMMHSSLFVEFVLHESAHLLFGRSSTFRIELFKAAKAMKVPNAKSLWHAAMFYLSGLATRDALDNLGQDHEFIMTAKGVFREYYHQPEFRRILDLYYNEHISTKEMAEQLTVFENTPASSEAGLE